MDSYNFSYNKLSIIRSIILGFLIYTITFIISFSLQNIITFKPLVKKSYFYKHNLKKFTCMPLEKQKKIGYTHFQNIITNLNTYFNPFHNNRTECDKITLSYFSKSYIFISGLTSLYVLLRLITNFTINTIVGYTISSDVINNPIGTNINKTKVNHFGTFIKSFGLFLFNVFIISIPVIFTYSILGKKYFNISNITKIRGKYDSDDIIRLIISVCLGLIFLIGPFIYIFLSLFSKNLFNEDNSIRILYDYFYPQDFPFVQKIYDAKDDIIINYGIWIVIILLLIIIQTKIINALDNKNFKYILIIYISLFIFALYISYRNYNITLDDDTKKFEQNIFDNNKNENNNLLTDQMFKKSINNLFQGIIKYNYPCMPFINN